MSNCLVTPLPPNWTGFLSVSNPLEALLYVCLRHCFVKWYGCTFTTPISFQPGRDSRKHIHTKANGLSVSPYSLSFYSSAVLYTILNLNNHRKWSEIYNYLLMLWLLRWCLLVIINLIWWKELLSFGHRTSTTRDILILLLGMKIFIRRA